MKTPGLLRFSGIVLTVGIAISGCARSGSAPPSPDPSLTGVTATPRPSQDIALAACALTPEVSKNETVGPKGQSLDVGSERLYIPAGALRGNAQVAVSKISRGIGGVNASGITAIVPAVFDVPLMVTLSYASCQIPAGKRPVIVQRRSDGVLVAPNSDQYVNAGLRTVTVALEHLSDYMMASAH